MQIRIFSNQQLPLRESKMRALQRLPREKDGMLFAKPIFVQSPCCPHPATALVWSRRSLL